MKKQPEITEATRNAFIQVFCEFYKERPIEKITVKEISEKAGYSRVTFYNYFKDPYDLLDYIEKEYVDHVVREIGSNIEHHKIEENFVYTFVKLINENKLYSEILLNNPHSITFINRFKKNIIPLLLKDFHIPESNQKAKYVLEFYVPGIISIICEWIQNDKDISIEELANIVKGILEEGILKQMKK